MQNNQNTDTMSFVSSKEFRTGVMPRAQLSMQASKLAVDKATQKNTQEFAGWELMEAIAVIKVLEDAGTPVPSMGAEAKAFLEKLKGLEGNDFDKEYMKAELSNHEFLRDLAQNYLDGTDEITYGGEKETWHVANLALFAFTEHVGLSKKICAELNA